MPNYNDITQQFFFEEAEEHLTNLEKGLLQLEQATTPDPEVIQELFRAAHTLKGSAALVKLKTISQVAHRLEDALEALRDSQTAPSQGEVDTMLFALDRIRELVRMAGQGQPLPDDVVSQVEQRFNDAAKKDAASSRLPEPSPPPPGSDGYLGREHRTFEPAADFVGPERRRSRIVSETPSSTATSVIKIGTEKLEALMNLLGSATITKTHLVGQLVTMRRIRDDVRFAGDRLLREVSHFSERYAYALPDQVRYNDELISDFQDLEFDRYDELNLFSRKLQEITSDINEAMRSMGSFFVDFNEEVESLDRMIVEMKERVSEARTVQASYLFQRFTRTIRELSRETGKNIDLIVAGGDTPIDRVIFDGLYDPMLHIVRNSVSHGIEQLQERLDAGKPETGTIWMSAKRRGNTLEVEVRDDGRGIQLDKVRQRAEEKGFLEPGEQISDRDLTQMIFRSGFSTTESTDTTSGRGIGMNVVMDRLASLSGTIDIVSVPGNGTTFRLTLPLSLVIINVIQFKVGRLSFVIPTNLVAEIIYFPPGEVPPETIEHGGENVPVVDLKKVFRMPVEASDRAFAIVSQASGKTVALLVDAVVSQEDTVIKPFGDFLREIPHLAGGSIGGDGTLRLVINPARLLAEVGIAHTVTESAPLPEETAAPVVLVVDDSLSVRKYAGMILKANGFKVLTANNGFEALEVLENNRADFIITDLEMPLMHGYELLAELMRRGVLATTPVAVLSSRAGQQHRDKAFELGARDYLVKPFEEESLLSMIRRHLPRAA